MKTLAVTGLDGFIAGYVVEEAQKRGYKVIGNKRSNEENPLLKDVTIYNIDMRDKAGIFSMIQHCDGVIHLAGLLGTSENLNQAELMEEVNVGGALNVLNACKNFYTPCVMIGVGNWTQLNTYSISKTTAERYGLMYAKYLNCRVNIVRALNAFGPRQKFGKINKIIPTFINKAITDQDITVYGGEKDCSDMDMVYAGDVAKVLLDVLEMTDRNEANAEVYEAGSGIAYPVYEIAKKIIDLTNSSSSIVEVPMRGGEDKSVIVAKNPYPIEYRDFDEVLKETVDYYVQSSN